MIWDLAAEELVVEQRISCSVAGTAVRFDPSDVADGGSDQIGEVVCEFRRLRPLPGLVFVLGFDVEGDTGLGCYGVKIISHLFSPDL
jgi:hypothetical protein